MLTDRLENDLGNGQTRRQAGVGVLEDHLNLRTDLAELVLGNVVNLNSVEVNLSGRLFRQTQDRLTDGGLATAGLAHKSHGGSLLNIEGDAVYSLDVTGHMRENTGLDGEILNEMVDLQHVILIVLDGKLAVDVLDPL